MWAREWFEAALEHHRAYEAMKERSERMRATLELGAQKYDAVPGGASDASDIEALIVADDELERMRLEHLQVLEAANALLWGDDGRSGAGKALGEQPAYAVHLRYLEGLSTREIASTLDCSAAWVSALCEKVFRWLDANTEKRALFWINAH